VTPTAVTPVQVAVAVEEAALIEEVSAKHESGGTGQEEDNLPAQDVEAPAVPTDTFEYVTVVEQSIEVEAPVVIKNSVEPQSLEDRLADLISDPVTEPIKSKGSDFDAAGSDLENE